MTIGKQAEAAFLPTCMSLLCERAQVGVARPVARCARRTCDRDDAPYHFFARLISNPCLVEERSPGMVPVPSNLVLQKQQYLRLFTATYARRGGFTRRRRNDDSWPPVGLVRRLLSCGTVRDDRVCLSRNPWEVQLWIEPGNVSGLSSRSRLYPPLGAPPRLAAPATITAPDRKGAGVAAALLVQRCVDRGWSASPRCVV